MDFETREIVRQRAQGYCEYCLLPEAALERSFHVEHIIAQQHLGGDDLDNLALACDRCNLYKGPNLSSIDPHSTQVVFLFHPRRDKWSDHFRLRSAVVDGLTPVGRATSRLLQMNAWRRVQLRRKIGMIDGVIR